MMDRDEEPYLIFTRNRPHRVALIVDISRASAVKDIVSLMNDASTKWGGRFFQLIPSKNKSVSTKWIEYLRDYDPDLIYTYTNLNKSTVKRISAHTNPYSFMHEGRFLSIPSYPDDPVDVLPDAQSTAMLWRNPLQQPEILSFDYGAHHTEGPRYIVNFIKANFGSMPDSLAHRQAIENARATHTVLPSRTKHQFLQSFNALDSWNRRIFPNEYSMLPGLMYESRPDHSSDMTSVYIGDNALDLILYWNDALSKPDWMATQKNQVWLPTRFLDDPIFELKVKSWLNKFSRQLNSNSDVKEIRLVSSSISQLRLEAYRDKLMSGTTLHPVVVKTDMPRPLVYSNRITTTSDMESYSVSGDKYTISIPEIKITQGGMGGQKWMTDVLVERKDHNDYRRPLKQYWLQFPRDNNLALYQVGHNNGRSGRINRDGVLSMPVSRDREVLRFNGTIPDMDTVTRTIVCGERNSIHYNGDLRDGTSSRPYAEVSNSVAGRSLRGAIHLFGGLSSAAHFFATPFWRDIFMTLAGANPLGNGTEINNLRTRIKKNLIKVKLPITDKAVEAWTKTVTSYASHIRADAQYKTYDWFLGNLKESMRLSDASEERYQLRELEPYLKSRLNWLLESSILNAGIMHTCVHCGLRSWYSVEEIKTDNTCKGCSYEFSIIIEEKWWYRLNTLISSNGGVFNQIPLILALGQLYEESTSSFFYHTPVDVRRIYGGRVETDLDIFAIVDGDLVIGEVKANQRLFNNEELRKIESAALKIRPDKVVLSAMMESPDAYLQSKINTMQIRLSTKGIRVEWLTINPITGDSLWGI